MPHLFACSVLDQKAMSGQGLVSRARTGTFAPGVLNNNLNSQAALGDANFHVDAVVLYKEHIYV